MREVASNFFCPVLCLASRMKICGRRQKDAHIAKWLGDLIIGCVVRAFQGPDSCVEAISFGDGDVSYKMSTCLLLIKPTAWSVPGYVILIRNVFLNELLIPPQTPIVMV